MGLTALAIGMVAGAPRLIAALGSERTISLYNIHTKDTLTILYKKDGKYLPDALEKVNWFMRDWRKNESIKMDPQLVDLLWEMHAELGSREPIHLICGYRSHSTNEMLRKTVGGQASQSRHILGKAADVMFPDVPLKRLRYSAIVRERGGVGYYPTSALPFIHVDIDRVRHWPRMPRYELALLFPDGKSKHVPSDGKPITREDARVARAQHKELAVQVAEFFDLRNRPKTPIVIAEAGRSPPAPEPARRPTPPPQQKVASLAPAAQLTPQLTASPRTGDWSPKIARSPTDADRAKLDKLATLAATDIAPPQANPIDRSSRFTQNMRSDADRTKLEELVALAAGAAPQPRLVAGPAPAQRRSPTFAVASLGDVGLPPMDLVAEPAAETPSASPRAAVLEPIGRPGPPEQPKHTRRFEWATAWVPAPAYDEEHPEELSYRPFPIAPMLTASESPDDAALTKLVHPDVSRTLDLIDDEGTILPMKLRPGQQVAELIWAQQFQGQAVDLDSLAQAEASHQTTSGITKRQVATTQR